MEKINNGFIFGFFMDERKVMLKHDNDFEIPFWILFENNFFEFHIFIF